MSQTESRRPLHRLSDASYLFHEGFSFLMHVDFFEKIDQKILSIDDIISQLIGLTYRDKIVDIVAI